MFSGRRTEYGFMDIGLRADIHSHILPGVDDGAGTIADSIEAINVLREAGVEHFTLTPHVSCGLFPNSASALRVRFEQFLEALPAGLRDEATFSLAAEYMVDEEFAAIAANARHGGGADGGLLSFPDGSILIEMSYNDRSPMLLDTVFNLVQGGFKPILAHPERYAFYFGDGRTGGLPPVIRSLGERFGLEHQPVKCLPELEKLVDMGCRLQLNVQSLTGCYGPASLDNLKYLLDRDLYTFVATDIHSAHQFGHYKGFAIGEARLSKVRMLAENNLAII